MYYFVCVNCDAKLFHDENCAICPRCGARLTSSDERVPPWIQHATKSDADSDTKEGERICEEVSEKAAHSPATNTFGSECLENRPTSSLDAEQQHAWQIQYRIQLQRRLCPGCGETDDIPS